MHNIFHYRLNKSDVNVTSKPKYLKYTFGFLVFPSKAITRYSIVIYMFSLELILMIDSNVVNLTYLWV
jgi:hypothetical protein